MGCSAQSCYLQWSCTMPPKCNNALSRVSISPILPQFYAVTQFRNLNPCSLRHYFSTSSVSEHLKISPEEMENSLRLINWFSFPLCGLQTSPWGLSQAERPRWPMWSVLYQHEAFTSAGYSPQRHCWHGAVTTTHPNSWAESSGNRSLNLLALEPRPCLCQQHVGIS